MRSLVSFAAAAALTFLAFIVPAHAAEKRGTLHLLPSGTWAKAVPEKALGKLRGGFRGLAFSAVFTAFVENRNGDLSGSASTGGAGTPPATTTNQNGQVSISTNVNFSGNLSGIFNIVQVPGNYNVVNSQLNVNIALINIGAGQAIPSLSTIFR